jgi:DNA repair exonuclease SbcCD nuclease subunit
MVRFVHTADWQLGMMPRSLSQEARGRFAEARIGVIRTIGALAKEQNCELVVVAGDVFESNQVDRTTVRRALDAMKAAWISYVFLAQRLGGCARTPAAGTVVYNVLPILELPG